MPNDAEGVGAFISATLDEEYTLHIFSERPSGQPRERMRHRVARSRAEQMNTKKSELYGRREFSTVTRTGLERGHGVPVTVCITESVYELQRVYVG